MYTLKTSPDMRRTLCILLALFVGLVSAEAQQRFTTLINAPFCIYAEPGHEKIVPPRPVPMCMLPKGTPVTVLGHSWWKHFVQVTLNDGSLGYIPTLAIAFPDVHIVGQYGSGNWTQGTYRLQSIGGWDGFQPKKLTFLHDNGRTYTFAPSDNILKSMQYKQALERLAYGDFFERHGIEYYNPDRDDKVLRLRLKEDELPLSLIGCSKSFIDKLISPAFGFAGPSVSEYKDYVYGFYENLIWPMPEVRKNLWGAGVIIYFDRELIAVHMEKMPWTYDFKPDYSTLRASTTPSESYSPETAALIERAKGAPRYRQAAPLTERYVALQGGAAVKLKMLYIFENHFGITNRWAIIGWLLGLVLVVQVVVYYLVRWFYKGPNRHLGTVALLAASPFTIYALIYVSRFYIIVAIIAFLFLIGFSLYASMVLESYAETDRCDRCRKWLASFEYHLLGTHVQQVSTDKGDKLAARLIFSEALPPVASKDFDIKLGWGALLSRSGSSSSVGDVQRSTDSRVWNYKTITKIIWPYRATLKCPHCGHTWNINLTRSTEEPGPIAYALYTDTRDQWTDHERIEWRRGDNGELIHSEDNSRSRSSTNSSSVRSFDTERYNIYLKRFLNGDHDALREYEREWFGNYWGD